MDTLRWVILLIGIVIVLGIYVFSTWQARRNQEVEFVVTGHIDLTLRLRFTQ